MIKHEASRTLVKSHPELWAECSDAGSLARHLGQFGEIRITRLEPETAVAWEGSDIRGTVRLEPSGWGTRVILTASGPGPGGREPAETAPQPAETAPEPARGGRESVAGTEEAQRPSRLGRIWRRWRSPPSETAPGPESDSETEPAPQEDSAPAAAALGAALDSLGMAHHRPYSRT